jgi:hypothetical protein
MATSASKGRADMLAASSEGSEDPAAAKTVVIVLWDYENVPIPSEVLAVNAGQAVLGLAAAFGRVANSHVFCKAANISEITRSVLMKGGFNFDAQRAKAEEVGAVFGAKLVMRPGFVALLPPRAHRSLEVA